MIQGHLPRVIYHQVYEDELIPRPNIQTAIEKVEKEIAILDETAAAQATPTPCLTLPYPSPETRNLG
jgi:hypothetical protein